MTYKKPQTKSFTWSQKSPFIFCRLGSWLFSNSLQDSIIYVDIIAAINRTDHSAIPLHLQELEDSEEYNVRMSSIKYSKKKGAKTKR